jgi:Carboxypeptidase regulatory-like domain
MTTRNELASVNHRILAWIKRHRAVLLAVVFIAQILASPLADRDPHAGAVLALILLATLNPVSGSVLTTFTDNAGAWSMPGVRRGPYLVRVEKNGYSPFARQLSVLSVHQELDVSLLPLAEDAPRGIGGTDSAAFHKQP